MTALNVTATEIELGDVRHWRLQRDADDLLWLCFDCEGASTNTLSSDVLKELAEVLDRVDSEQPSGMVMYSAKSSGFAAGADISEFDRMTDPDSTAAMIDDVHELFERLERYSFATVAVVHGFCLGGGLELALACRHLIAADEHDTRLGFPEVLLGIHPGFGGTVRSVRDCGALAALDLMLTGRSLNARRARAAGLADSAVPGRHLQAAARRFALETRAKRQPKPWLRWASLPGMRTVVAQLTRWQIGRRAREAHYPAPYAVVDLWQQHGGDPAAMYRAEARSIARLLTTPTSRNLVRLFKLQERLKRSGAESGREIRHVHVIGAGTMGGDIAAWCALQGFSVTLEDRKPADLGPAFKRAGQLFARRKRDKYERMRTSDRLVPDFSGAGVERADVIIEAIIEDADTKRALFKDLEQKAQPDALLATNTSSIELSSIAADMSSPERLVGIHFFNPVAQMQLVEIIASETTDPEVAAASARFTTAINRLPVTTASSPGFLINRVLSPYLQEAMVMQESSNSAESIDRVACDFGMPMGPLALADTVGLDICLHVGEILSEAFGGEVPASLRRMVAARRLGKKSGEGYYRYPTRKKIFSGKPEQQLADTDIRDRMILRLVNEAVACLADGIVADADLIDVAMVFGTGFAPFRGGPIAYARDRGVAEIMDRLNALEREYGERFRPHPGWLQFDDLTQGP